jgi:osomolarity two-component system sensor histidine kinase NIK1
MTGADETLAAATAVLQSLARDEPTRGSVSLAFDFEFPATNGAKSSTIISLCRRLNISIEPTFS